MHLKITQVSLEVDVEGQSQVHWAPTIAKKIRMEERREEEKKGRKRRL